MYCLLITDGLADVPREIWIYTTYQSAEQRGFELIKDWPNNEKEGFSRDGIASSEDFNIYIVQTEN